MRTQIAVEVDPTLQAETIGLRLIEGPRAARPSRNSSRESGRECTFVVDNDDVAIEPSCTTTMNTVCCIVDLDTQQHRIADRRPSSTPWAGSGGGDTSVRQPSHPRPLVAVVIINLDAECVLAHTDVWRPQSALELVVSSGFCAASTLDAVLLAAPRAWSETSDSSDFDGASRGGGAAGAVPAAALRPLVEQPAPSTTLGRVFQHHMRARTLRPLAKTYGYKPPATATPSARPPAPPPLNPTTPAAARDGRAGDERGRWIATNLSTSMDRRSLLMSALTSRISHHQPPPPPTDVPWIGRGRLDAAAPASAAAASRQLPTVILTSGDSGDDEAEDAIHAVAGGRGGAAQRNLDPARSLRQKWPPPTRVTVVYTSDDDLADEPGDDDGNDSAVLRRGSGNPPLRWVVDIEGLRGAESHRAAAADGALPLSPGVGRWRPRHNMSLKSLAVDHPGDDLGAPRSAAHPRRSCSLMPGAPPAMVAVPIFCGAEGSTRARRPQTVVAVVVDEGGNGGGAAPLP